MTLARPSAFKRHRSYCIISSSRGRFSCYVYRIFLKTPQRRLSHVKNWTSWATKGTDTLSLSNITQWHDRIPSLCLDLNVVLHNNRGINRLIATFSSFIKYEYSLFFLLPHDSKLNIFGLRTKQNIWGRYLRLLETMINIFHHFLTDEVINTSRQQSKGDSKTCSSNEMLRFCPSLRSVAVLFLFQSCVSLVVQQVSAVRGGPRRSAALHLHGNISAAEQRSRSRFPRGFDVNPGRSEPALQLCTDTHTRSFTHTRTCVWDTCCHM